MDALKVHLKQITHGLPGPIRDIGLSLLGSECYQSLVLDIDETDTECLKLATSKALGVGIIAGSSTVKVPQILKLISSQSATGISFLSYVLETLSMIITLAYSARNGFPFSTYGETALIAAQNVAISLLVLRFQGKSLAATVFVGGLLAVGYALQNESLVDMKTLSYAQAAAGALAVASKAPQIFTNWQEGGTGQLSAFAVSLGETECICDGNLTQTQVFNYLLGSLSRIFTTLQEVDDPLILYGYIAGFVLNVIMAAQMVQPLQPSYVGIDTDLLHLLGLLLEQFCDCSARGRNKSQSRENCNG